MNKRLILWGIPAAIWILFTAWYTDFGGPLSDEEVKKAMAYFDARDGLTLKRKQQLQAFFENDSGRQFLMVNNIQMNPSPPTMPGFDADATAEDYSSHYMEHMYPELFSRACHPVFYASGLGFAADVSGIENAEGWDTAALFRYRSRRSFLEIITNPEIGPRHDFKLAAMTKTIAYPVETSLYLSDPRLLLFLAFGLVTAMIDIFVYGRGKPNG